MKLFVIFNENKYRDDDCNCVHLLCYLFDCDRLNSIQRPVLNDNDKCTVL